MKILIANRGEIAVRIVRACREMGLRQLPCIPTAIASRATCARRTRRSHIGPSEAAGATCASTAIIDAARRSGADAVHPGYGFLAENAAFASACQDAGLMFIGPSPTSSR